MSEFITGVIAFPLGMIAGGVLTALYGRKVVHQVSAELERFKAELRSKL